MISAFWDVATSIIRAFFQVIGALSQGFFDVLSALLSAVLWPLRAVWAVLTGNWEYVGQWTPLYFVLCVLVLLSLAALVAYGSWRRGQKR